MLVPVLGLVLVRELVLVQVPAPVPVLALVRVAPPRVVRDVSHHVRVALPCRYVIGLAAFFVVGLSMALFALLRQHQQIQLEHEEAFVSSVRGGFGCGGVVAV